MLYNIIVKIWNKHKYHSNNVPVGQDLRPQINDTKVYAFLCFSNSAASTP